MLKNALWKNPIGWSENIVGTKLNFWLIIFLQIFFASGILFIVFFLLPFYRFLQFCIIPIFGTVVLPTAYIYALSRVLRELSKEKGLKPKDEQK